MNPPDPPGVGDKSLQVSSIPTFSCHMPLLPFPEPLGSLCSFSVSSPLPQPLPLLHLIPPPWSGRQQTATIDFPGSAKPSREGSTGRGQAAVTRAMAVPSRPQAGCEGDGGEVSRCPRSLPALRLVFWETWVAFPPLCPEQPWFVRSSGGEMQLLHGTLLETLQWGSGKPSALPALGVNSPLLSPDRPRWMRTCFPQGTCDFLKPVPS